MGKDSEIAWTHHTFNPWWGCVKIAPECAHCYAADAAHRYGFNVWGLAASRRFFSDGHWNEPLKWNRAAKAAGERHRVFCASMADVFEDRRDLDRWRERLFWLICQTPQLDWLLLSKRPENAPRLVPWVARPWPANIWFGTTIGHPDSVGRLEALRAVDVGVRFVSAEPLLAPLSFVDERTGRSRLGIVIEPGRVAPPIDWIILGGESGPQARPMELYWVRALMREAREAGTRVFVKQLGRRPADLPRGSGGDDGVLELLSLRDAKGGDMDEWPADLRVREFPREAVR